MPTMDFIDIVGELAAHIQHYDVGNNVCDLELPDHLYRHLMDQVSDRVAIEIEGDSLVCRNVLRVRKVK